MIEDLAPKTHTPEVPVASELEDGAGIESIPDEVTPEIRRIAMKWLAKAVVGLPIYGICLFALAGTFRWPSAWVFLTLFFVASTAHAVLMYRTNPWLLGQRTKGLNAEGALGWDKVITGLGVGLLPVVSWTVAALDFRFGWSPDMAPWVQVSGVVLFIASWVLVLWATYANSYFTTIVRIQPNHSVQTGGPYRYVRHPGYVGSIAYILSTPLVLGSWWALVPAVGGAAMMLLRTALEDRYLQDGLPGYRDFATRVRYRLVPGVW